MTDITKAALTRKRNWCSSDIWQGDPLLPTEAQIFAWPWWWAAKWRLQFRFRFIGATRWRRATRRCGEKLCDLRKLWVRLFDVNSYCFNGHVMLLCFRHRADFEIRAFSNNFQSSLLLRPFGFSENAFWKRWQQLLNDMTTAMACVQTIERIHSSELWQFRKNAEVTGQEDTWKKPLLLTDLKG